MTEGSIPLLPAASPEAAVKAVLGALTPATRPDCVEVRVPAAISSGLFERLLERTATEQGTPMTFVVDTKAYGTLSSTFFVRRTR